MTTMRMGRSSIARSFCRIGAQGSLAHRHIYQTEAENPRLDARVVRLKCRKSPPRSGVAGATRSNVPRGNDKPVAWGYAVLWRRPAGFYQPRTVLTSTGATRHPITPPTSPLDMMPLHPQ